jgi:hypothetical protein
MGLSPWTGFNTINRLFYTPIADSINTIFPGLVRRAYSPTFGPLAMARRNLIMLQLLSHMKKVRLEDVKLLNDGLDSIDEETLDQLCYERAIPGEYMSVERKQEALKEWVDTSTRPTSSGKVAYELLVYSRIFDYIDTNETVAEGVEKTYVSSDEDLEL